MLAFAGNSLLCRLALKHTAIDPASFTSIRLVSAAIVLWLLVYFGSRKQIAGSGNWLSALALLGYAALFSFAYVGLSAGAGALLLFGSVQVTMIGYGLWSGERFWPRQIGGLFLAFAGLVGLVFPGLTAPPLFSAALMLGAGVAWGIYTLRGRGAGDPLKVTAGNFLLTLPSVVVLSLLTMNMITLDLRGVIYAVLSGGVTSGIGYAVWYSVLPSLKATQAATMQLSVPVIASVGGIVLLGEPLSLRLVLASAAILFGIALVLEANKRVA